MNNLKGFSRFHKKLLKNKETIKNKETLYCSKQYDSNLLQLAVIFYMLYSDRIRNQFEHSYGDLLMLKEAIRMNILSSNFAKQNKKSLFV